MSLLATSSSQKVPMRSMKAHLSSSVSQRPQLPNSPSTRWRLPEISTAPRGWLPIRSGA